MANWNITKLDEGFIRPQVMVGPVIVNGGMHASMCSRVRNNKNPYYPHASGIYSNNYSNICQADIVFTLARSPIAAYTPGHGNAIRMPGMSVLNGHGCAGPHGNEILMQDINVLGFAEVPTTPNNQGFFNIVRGGIMTVLNNSKWRIEVGDYLEAYAPTLEEMGDGGSGKESEAYGEVKLWLKPFDPLQSSLSSKPIYNCLTANDKSGHTKLYRETCKKFLQGAKDIALVVIASALKKIKTELGAAATDDLRILNKLSEYMDSGKAVDDVIIPKLFVPYSGKQNLIEPTKTPKESKLNEKQVRCVDQYLKAASVLHHHVHKNVFAQATSTADPQKNLSVQQIRYAK